MQIKAYPHCVAVVAKEVPGFAIFIALTLLVEEVNVKQLQKRFGCMSATNTGFPAFPAKCRLWVTKIICKKFFAGQKEGESLNVFLWYFKMLILFPSG